MDAVARSGVSSFVKRSVRPGESTARCMVIIWTDTLRNGENGLSAFVQMMLKNVHVKHDLR